MAAVRQSAVAGNIANVNTPGYSAVDVEPFEKVLDKTGVSHGRHAGRPSPGRATEAGFAVREDERDASLLPSENTVVLENELMKAGEIRRSFELNTAIVKAFHRMMHDEREELTMDPLAAALKVAASGLGAQSERLRVVSENLANAQSTGDTPGADPYRRKTISFAAELDRATGGSTGRGQQDRPRPGGFPGRVPARPPAADDKGYVKMPNVNVLVEMADMSEANRSYEANLQVIKQARD